MWVRVAANLNDYLVESIIPRASKEDNLHFPLYSFVDVRLIDVGVPVAHDPLELGLSCNNK